MQVDDVCTLYRCTTFEAWDIFSSTANAVSQLHANGHVHIKQASDGLCKYYVYY